jgi:hypothetical protein
VQPILTLRIEELIGAVSFSDWLLNEHPSCPIFLRSEYAFFSFLLVKLWSADGRSLLGWLRHKWEDNIKNILNLQHGRELCIYLVQDWDYLWALVNTKMNRVHKSCENSLVKKDCAPWSYTEIMHTYETASVPQRPIMKKRWLVLCFQSCDLCCTWHKHWPVQFNSYGKIW